MSEPFTTAQELGLKSADAVIAALRAELAAERGKHTETALALGRVDAERDALRALLREAYEWRDALWPVSTTVRIAAALNKGGGDE